MIDGSDEDDQEWPLEKKHGSPLIGTPFGQMRLFNLDSFVQI
jgi:hypothetical protein